MKRNYYAKLTEEEVQVLRVLRPKTYDGRRERGRTTYPTLAELSRRFGVSKTAIWSALKEVHYK